MSRDPSPSLVTLKRLIWLYFWLLIFEGSLRKWVFPGLSNPLLLVRDPVVVLIYVFAIIGGAFPTNGFLVFTYVLAVVTVGVSELAGHGNLLVTLYGFRTSFLHLPLIFLIKNVFDRKDIEQMARWILITTIPMAFLVLLQFRGSPDAWLNNGVAGNVGGQLEVGFGKIRPPGTFSFTSVLVLYLSGTAAFAIHAQMMGKNSANGRLSHLALPAIALMVGISGSRGAFSSVMLVVVAVFIVCVRKPAFFGRWIKTVALGAVVFVVLSSWSEFRHGLEIHQNRFSTGGGFTQGILLRTLSGLGEPFQAAIEAPFFGMGLGMGTNGASGFMYGRVAFNLGEGDWGRTIREVGPVLGFAYIGLRIAILAFLAHRSLASLQRDNPLPILVLAAAAPMLLNGQIGVPAMLGFGVFNGALCLAATNCDPVAVTVEEPEPVALDQPFGPPVGPRGRSNYASELHGETEDPTTARYGP